MIIKLVRFGIEHKYTNVYKIYDAGSYLVLEPLHAVISEYIDGDWHSNYEAVTIHKLEFDGVEVL